MNAQCWIVQSASRRARAARLIFREFDNPPPTLRSAVENLIAFAGRRTPDVNPAIDHIKHVSPPDLVSRPAQHAAAL